MCVTPPAYPHSVTFSLCASSSVHVYLCIARACRGLKRVPVRGCRRKCPGTAAWRFFMDMQSPLTSRPKPPRPRNSPTTTSGVECWGRPTDAMTPPAVNRRMPRQISMPWESGISGAPVFFELTSCSYGCTSTSAAASLQERSGGSHTQHPVQLWICARVCVCVRESE